MSQPQLTQITESEAFKWVSMYPELLKLCIAKLCIVTPLLILTQLFSIHFYKFSHMYKHICIHMHTYVTKIDGTEDKSLLLFSHYPY